LGVDNLPFHSAVVALGINVLLHLLMIGFRKSFTLGEAALWAIFVGMLAGDALAATIFRVRRRPKPLGGSLVSAHASVQPSRPGRAQARLYRLPAFMAIHRTPVHLFLASLVLGIIGIGILLAPLLHAVRHADQAPGAPAAGWQLWGYSQRAVVLSLAFVALAALIVFGLISPWMRLFLREDPFLWTFAFLTHGWRLAFVVYWAAAIAGSVSLLAVRDRWRPDAPAAAQPTHLPLGLERLLRRVAGWLAGLPLIMLRKYFHVLAVFMFSPGLLVEVREEGRQSGAPPGNAMRMMADALRGAFLFGMPAASRSSCSWRLASRWPRSSRSSTSAWATSSPSAPSAIRSSPALPTTATRAR